MKSVKNEIENLIILNCKRQIAESHTSRDMEWLRCVEALNRRKTLFASCKAAG